MVKKKDEKEEVVIKKGLEVTIDLKTLIIIILGVLVVIMAIALLKDSKKDDTAKVETVVPTEDVSTKSDTKSKGVKTSQTQTVHNDDGDYQFETGADYLITQSGKTTTVYTAGEKAMPYYTVIKMNNSLHSTMVQKVDNLIEATKNRYQNRLTGEPQKTTVKINGETVRGLTYAYSTEDGSKVVYVEQYLMPEVGGDDYFVWTANSYDKNAINVDAMKKAMTSIREWDD